MFIAPADTKGVVADWPSLNEVQLFILRVGDYLEAGFFRGEGFGVRRVTLLLSTSGAGAMGAQKFAGEKGLFSCGPSNIQARSRIRLFVARSLLGCSADNFDWGGEFS